MFSLKNEPQNLAGIMEQSFCLYRHVFISSLPYSFLATALLFIPQLLSALIMMPSYFPWIVSISFLLALVPLSALIFRIYCYCYQIPSDFKTSFHHARSKFISILLLGVLYGLVVLGATMLLIVPGIILMITLMFSFSLMITDNQSVLETLLHSHRLVWGNWWQVVSAVAIPFLMNLTATLSFILLILSLGSYFEWQLSQMKLVLTGTNILIQILFIPLIFSVTLVLLHDLRRKVVVRPYWQ